MKKIMCPCCENYTIESDDEIIVEICEVCFWQYDLTAHKQPNLKIGANGVTLNEARENYKRYGACKKEFADKGLVRKPFSEELREENI